jgi:hypothetical protein
MIPVFCPPNQIRWADLVEHDEVVRRYRAFLALFDWTQITERRTDRPWPGPIPHPCAAYVKAFLVKIVEEKTFMTDLRRYLIDHPLLVLSLGFRPVPDPQAVFGFDVEQTVPCAGWLCDHLRTIDEPMLKRLLQATVRDLQGEIAHLGDTVAFDVKHIYAWVQENNPKAFIAHRFDPRRQPAGDADCRLGIKRRSNQKGPDGEALGPTLYLWGYGTGIASATAARYGDVVLAEVTQTFNENDATSFAPLYEQVHATLGHRPTNITADAAFDAWRIYATCVATGGIPAIPLNLRGQRQVPRTPEGMPRCTHQYVMTPGPRFVHEDGYRAQRFTCPLLHPRKTGATCSDPHFATGGCTHKINLEPGGMLRMRVDRASPAYQAIYDQRTCAERINSQATALGIERPKVRNQRSIHHLNTLTYLVINARALRRARIINGKEASAA